jgi:threonine/homoserine/homoserine lactone efflux protein
VNTFEFAVEVIFLSASGVLSPGPLFFANLIYGSRQGFRGGILMLSFGLFHFSMTSVAHNATLKSIELLGGIAIIIFSILQIRSVVIRENNTIPGNHIDRAKYSLSNKPILGGIIFSLLNPFFLVWWFTVGLKIISDSISLFGIVLGSLAVFIFHIWMDYVWLGGTSFLVQKGISILDVRFYNIFLLGLSILLVIFGLYWIVLNVY